MSSPNSSRRSPGLRTCHAGHRRSDLTSEDVLFRRIFSYLVIYQRGSDPLQIVAVLNAKRDVARILAQRSDP